MCNEIFNILCFSFYIDIKQYYLIKQWFSLNKLLIAFII